MEKLDFKQWIEMAGSTGAVFDPHVRSRDWNWLGSPGTTGVTPKEGPIKHWVKKGKKGKKKND